MAITSHHTYEGRTFKRVALKAQTISKTQFVECAFTRCDFSEVAFKACHFLDCTFDDCTMRLTNVENTTFAKVRFDRCNLLGINWTQADWSQWTTKLSAMTFTACDLTYGIFLGLELKNAVMTDCIAHEINLAEANLTDADFAGTDFASAIFLQTDLTRANFVGAKNYTLNLNDNTTKAARFALPEAIRLLESMDLVLVDPAAGEADETA